MFLESRPQEINFKGKQAHAWHYLNDNKTSEIFYGGAAGGGKSFLGCIWHITNRIRYPESRGLIGRAKISNLEQSTLVTLFKVASFMGYVQGIDFFYNQQKHVINWINGSQTILKDLFLYPSDPDFISLGSTEYTDAFIDEGTEVTQKAFDIVNSRIRWKLPEYNLIPKILVTCNPSPGWVKDNYVMDVHNKPIKLKEYQKFVFALVDDNPDKMFVSIYRQQLTRMFSEYDKARLLFGDWNAEPEINNPFAIQYDPAYHESEAAIFRRDKQLYISIDFNLNPFAVTFWHHWQDQDGWYFHGIDEAEIEHGSIPAMVDLIKSRYGQYLHTAILTGDAMGKQGQISQRDNASHYQSMKRELNLSNSQIQVPANPTHVNSRDDVNRILFEAKKPGARIKFFLSPSRMPNTCRDMRVVQCDAHGAIMKGNRNDLNQRGDFLDCLRYYLNLVGKPIILKYLR